MNRMNIFFDPPSTTPMHGWGTVLWRGREKKRERKREREGERGREREREGERGREREREGKRGCAVELVLLKIFVGT